MKSGPNSKEGETGSTVLTTTSLEPWLQLYFPFTLNVPINDISTLQHVNVQHVNVLHQILSSKLHNKIMQGLAQMIQMASKEGTTALTA